MTALRPGAPGTTIVVRAPWDGRVLGEVQAATLAEVAAAVTAAARCARDDLRRRSPYERYAWLQRLADAIAGEAEPLALQIVDEAGKPLSEARTEVARAAQSVRYAAEEALRLHGVVQATDVTPAVVDRTALIEYVPLGVVAAITPFNFPLNIPVAKVAPALAAGNAVVLKPSPRTPLVAARLVALAHAAGVPPAALTLLHGDVEQARALAAHADVRALSFTGSIAAGQALAAVAGMKKLLLELGGNDPLIVWPDADMAAAATTAVAHGCGYGGQRCTAVKRLFVHRDAHAAFLAALLDCVDAAHVGDPRDPRTLVGPLINADAAAGVWQRVEQAVRDGARMLRGEPPRGTLLRPVVLDQVPLTTPLVATETFGPALPLVSFRDLDELVDQVNATPYGLQAGVYTNDLRVVRRLHRDLEVGALVVNGGPGLRVDSVPFGGVKQSGLGREGIAWAMREYSETKVLYW